MNSNTFQVALKESVPNNSLEYLNEIRIRVLATSDSMRTGVIYLGGIYTGGGINILTKNGYAEVYTASSASDLVTSGKTKLTSITTDGYYIFHLTQIGEDDIIFRCISSTQTLSRVNANACGGTLQMYMYDLKFVNGFSPIFYSFNLATAIGTMYQLSSSDSFNADVFINVYNMQSLFLLSGNITGNSYFLAQVSPSLLSIMCTPIADFSIDLSAFIPDTVNGAKFPKYIYLIKNSNYDQSAVQVLASGNYANMYLAKSHISGIQLLIYVTTSTAVNDKILLALAANPYLSTEKPISSVIVLTGGRTSASDTAIASILASGITVTMNS